MNVKEILNTKGSEIISIPAEKTVLSAVEFMIEKRIGALVVSEGADLCAGIISERDVMRGIARAGDKILTALVGDFMTRELHKITPDTELTSAMQIMTENRCRHLPVFDDTRLCGMISIGDVVNAQVNEARREADSLKAYIATG